MRRFHRQGAARAEPDTRWQSRRDRRRLDRASRCAAGRPASWESSSAEARIPASGSSDRPASGATARPRPHRHGQAVFHQADGHGFIEAGAGKDLAHGRLDPLAKTPRRARNRHRAVFGNMFVAVNPRHLFDQVDLALQVAPPGRRAEAQASSRCATPLRAPGPSRSARPSRDRCRFPGPARSDPAAAGSTGLSGLRPPMSIDPG